MKIRTPMLKVSKKKVVFFYYRRNFNHFVVVEVIFYVKFLQTSVIQKLVIAMKNIN